LDTHISVTDKLDTHSDKSRFGNFIDPPDARRDLPERFDKTFMKR